MKPKTLSKIVTKKFSPISNRPATPRRATPTKRRAAPKTSNPFVEAIKGKLGLPHVEPGSTKTTSTLRKKKNLKGVKGASTTNKPFKPNYGGGGDLDQVGGVGFGP